MRYSPRSAPSAVAGIRAALLAVAVGLLATGLTPAPLAALGRPEAGSGASGTHAPVSILIPNTVSSVPVLALADEFPGDYRTGFYTDHPLALAQLINGEADVVATGFTVGYARYRSVGDLVHLATPVWGASALMTARPLTGFADLAGGTVYAPFEGSPIDLHLKVALAAAGLADRVSIAYAPFPQASAFLVEGRALAAVLVEPLASRLELEGRAYRLENLHDGWARVSGGERRSPQVSLFARSDAVDSRRAQFSLLASRLAPIVRRVAADPAAYARQYAAVLGLPEEVVHAALANTLFDAPGDAESRAVITRYLEIMGLAAVGPAFYASLE